MSVTMTKTDGVTLVTLTSDRQSAWPPLCQIFKGLCYSPVCCSVSQDHFGHDCASLLFVFLQMLVFGINGVLIVLSVLEFCVAISSVVLGIKATHKHNRVQEGKSRRGRELSPTESMRELIL